MRNNNVNKEKDITDKTSSYLAAAVKILRSEGRPLTGKELTDLAIRRGLIDPKGKTPIATMVSKLYVGLRDPNFQIERLAQTGHTRATRGSVRWLLKKT